jgi:hypothetical protein
MGSMDLSYYLIWKSCLAQLAKALERKSSPLKLSFVNAGGTIAQFRVNFEKFQMTIIRFNGVKEHPKSQKSPLKSTFAADH